MQPAANREKSQKSTVKDRLGALNRAILDSALDCIITMDGTGHVQEFNPAAERTFGYKRAEAVGRELAELIIPPSLRDRHRQGLAHYLKTGRGPVLGQRLEMPAVRADGSELAVELAINAVAIEGAPIFTAYLRDITDQKREESARRRLAAIVESSEDAIIGKNLEGIITNWNQAAERLFGYTAEEILGRPVTTLIPSDLQKEEPTIIARVRRGERIEHYETIRQRKDGTLFNISLTVSPIKDDDGNVIGASKIVRDISDRVRAEKRMAAQYRVANLLAGSWSFPKVGPQVIQTIAESGNWIFGSIWLCDQDPNEGLRCETTWHAPGVRLEKFAEASHAMVLKRNVGLPGRVMASEKPVWISDVRRDKNFPRAPAAATAGLHGAFGIPLWANDEVQGVLELFSAEPGHPDENLLKLVEALGSQIGIFIYRRKIEAELQRQKEAAESANAAKDRFLATLSHELRTPLTPVLMWAGGMAGQTGVPPEIQEGLQMVCRNVELEARLIDDLLDLTKITRGKLQLHLRKSDAHDLLGHAMEIVRDEIASRELKLCVQLQASDHYVLADATRLQQVFWNVLRNASKFTPPRGEVTVRTFNPKPQALMIEISDTGIGIDPESLERVFDAFEQAGPHREGLGLGLAISRAIVEMHRGSIRAFSEGRGKGAKFIIDLETISGPS